MMTLIAVAALALDLANIYLAKSLDQRIADLSALAAAFAYTQSSSNTTVASNAASGLAIVNGAGSASVVTTFASSPSGDGSRAAKVVVTSVVPLSPFGRAIAQAGVLSMNVSATSYAEIHNAVPCMAALGSGGITATGGVTVQASGCSLGSGGSITATDGAHITGQSLAAVGTISAPNNDGATVATSPATTGEMFPGSSAQSDPFDPATVFSRMPSVAALDAPTSSMGNAPSGGSTQVCASGTMTILPGTYSSVSANSGCTGLTFTAGTYNISGGLYFGSGGTLTVNVPTGVTLNVWGGINETGVTTTTVKGPATYNVQGGITQDSNGKLTFNNANSSATSTFQVAGGISLSGSAGSFPDGDYTIGNTNGTGLYIASNTVAVFGNGSFIISGTQGGITVGTSAHLTIGSGLTDISLFEITGIAYSYDDAISVTSNSTLVLGDFTNFDINGAVNLDSSVTFGAGIYTINGAFSACSSGGSIVGSGVSIIASGTLCFGAGFNSVTLSAPATIDSSTSGSVSTIALASESSSASEVNAGATNTVVQGAVYLPYAALTLDGAGNLNGGGGCLEIVAKSLSFSGGSGSSTDCSSLGGGGSSGTSVTVVQ